MVDLLHVYGIAVVFDVVYNHAGGWGQTTRCPRALRRKACCMATTIASTSGTAPCRPARTANWDNNQSLYFTDQGFVGGLSFALWNADVRGFLRNNALVPSEGAARGWIPLRRDQPCCWR